MKKLIKKMCAIVMMTAILFTAVAPKPVLAATCKHNRVSTASYEIKQRTGTSSHSQNGKTCTIYHYQIFKVTRWCLDCNAVLEKTFVRTYEEHTGDF